MTDRELLFWISWRQSTDDARPISFPPNDSILGWWVTGYTQGGATICAMVVAENEEAAKRAVLKDWPEAEGWRFVEKRDTAKLSDRFPLRDWMKPRFAAIGEQMP